MLLFGSILSFFAKAGSDTIFIQAKLLSIKRHPSLHLKSYLDPLLSLLARHLLRVLALMTDLHHWNPMRINARLSLSIANKAPLTLLLTLKANNCASLHQAKHSLLMSMTSLFKPALPLLLAVSCNTVLAILTSIRKLVRIFETHSTEWF